MDDEAEGGKWTGMALVVAGLAATGAAIFASGGLAILGGITAIGCLAGSIAAALGERRETAFDRHCRECDSQTAAREETPAISPHHHTPEKSWVASLETRQASRHR